MTNSTFTIKAVLFDWDMTVGAALGNISAIERTSALLRHVGLNYSHEVISTARNERQTRIEQGLLPGPIAPQTKEGLIVYYQQLLSLLRHPEALPSLAEEIYTAYAHLPFVLYPDTLPALRALAGQAVQLGVISNHSPHIRPVIETHLGEFVRPEHIVISGEINLYKPGRAIFLEAARRLDLPAGQCLYVGDNLEVDAIGAVTAGGYACGLWCDRSDESAPEDLPQGVYRIIELGQVLPYVKLK